MVARWSMGIGLVVLAVAALGHAEDGAPAAASGAASSGMWVHVDPRSGRFVEKPVTPPPARPLPAPVPQLAEVPAPGGGMMVDVSGHFMSNLVARVNPDGTIRMECVTGDAPVPTDR